MGQVMVKALAAVSVLGAFIAALLAATELQAAATVACPFQGKTVQVVIANTKDGPRSCNAVCIWSYTNVPLRGAGGAMLETGETRTVFNNTAPFKIDGLVTSEIVCNR
jgi:hypothetical protein